MPLFLAIPRRPPSSNRGPNHKFQETIKEEARRRLGTEQAMVGDLYARITWFHAEPTTQDVDSIAKNVLDALKRTIFADDVQVVQCLSSKVNAAGDYELIDHDLPSQLLEELLVLLASSKHVLYVEVGEVVSSRVVFGPIDGGGT